MVVLAWGSVKSFLLIKMSTPSPKIPTFPPQFLDFKSIFKNSLESIEGTTYSSIFDDINPSSNMCKDGGKEFTDISTWYRASWKSKINSFTTKPTDLVSLCEAYQKECLLSTNWTIVNSWNNDNDTKSLTQFCPQPPLSTTTKQIPSSGFTFTTTDFKSSAKLATSSSTSSIRAFNGRETSATRCWYFNFNKWYLLIQMILKYQLKFYITLNDVCFNVMSSIRINFLLVWSPSRVNHYKWQQHLGFKKSIGSRWKQLFA